MATAIIGENYTFQVFFVDELNNALAVNSPTISVFYFDENKDKQKLVDAATLSAPADAETGRYVYPYTIPGTLSHGVSIVAEFSGTDPDTGLTVLSEQSVDLVSASSSGGNMVSRFVKGG